jgi:hypothetical protein
VKLKGRTAATRAQEEEEEEEEEEDKSQHSHHGLLLNAALENETSITVCEKSPKIVLVARTVC